MLERRDATDDEARALASSVRLRILRICLYEGRTNKQIAEVLERDPASTLHHVRTLVRTGFLVAEDERRGLRGAREIPYRATGKSWNLSTPADDHGMYEAFAEELRLVPAEQVDASRLGLRLPPEQMQEFRDRLAALLEEFARRDRDLSAPAWSLFVSLHPDPNHPTP